MSSPAFKAVSSPYLAPFDGSFRTAAAATRPPHDAPGKEENRQQLAATVRRLSELQEVLYADDRWAVLIVFQALDAAGKDGTISAVFSGVNPAGCQVFSFKAPSAEELDHDFLWRTARDLPEQGRIGVFNRSHYEEVLIVRVHPEFLAAQNLPSGKPTKDLWRGRYESIADHERHLARNGMAIVKFWLHVSKEEQARRFLSRLEEPEKHWKFSERDIAERRHWDDYMKAYEEALNATSRPWAPWYVIPADDKAYMRMCVADLIVRNLERLDLKYPSPMIPEAQRSKVRAELRKSVRD
jgi:PPK2 family polyphosphate:nucleotide phosphotransferase